jgi:hypothetical protein
MGCRSNLVFPGGDGGWVTKIQWVLEKDSPIRVKPSITVCGVENDLGKPCHFVRTLKASQFAREYPPTDIDDFLSPGGLVPRHPNPGIGAALNPEPTPRELRGATQFAGHADAPSSLGGGEKEFGIATSATNFGFAHGFPSTGSGLMRGVKAAQGRRTPRRYRDVE